MKRLLLINVGLWVMLGAASAQNAPILSLKQCIDTALTRNIQVRQTALTTEAAAANRTQAKAALLPDLGITADHGNNRGRSIDPFTNAYVNQSVNYAGYGINSGVVVFSGGTLRNTVRQTGSIYDATKMELQQDRDNLTLNVILAYLQVLTNEDLVLSAMQQRELSLRQLERLAILDSQGAVKPSEVSDVKGQLMNDELTILNLKASVETAKLELAQLMNIPYNRAMKLQKVDVEDLLTAYNRSAEDIYQTALQRFALVKAVALRKQSAQYALRAAKGAMYPTLVFGVGGQTNYSSVAENNTGKISYGEQVGNNIFSSLNLGLRIPIFNALRAKTNVKLADITLRNSALIEENTKVELRQQIEQAHLNMTTAYERYKTLLEQVEAYDISFKAAEARFNAGVGTSVDYLVAKNNLDRANINLISAKYEFALRKQVLDYYEGDARR